MSKVAFQIGTADHLLISLPNKMCRNGNVFAGKAKLRTGSLMCSRRVFIHKSNLEMFFDQASKAYETLRGEFTLASDDGGFVLKGIMTNKGHARIEVAFEGGELKMPDDSNWSVRGDFTCYPDDLKRVLEAKAAI